MLKTANDPAVRSRNMPDVLFVDEDGNPIEAGNENVVYVDETGNEIPEEIAQQLLETGKYLDSRELYQGGDNSFVGANDSQAAFDGSHASFQASVLGSYSKGSGFIQRNDSTSAANHHSSGVAQSHAIALAEAQARIFAEAQLQMKRREEEIAQIEADANRESSRLKELIENSGNQQQYQQELEYQHQMQQLQQQQHLQQMQQLQQQQHQQQMLQQQFQQQQQHQEFNKSLSNTDVEKSQSLRRIPMPPPKKNSDVSETSSNSYNNLKSTTHREQSGTSLYSTTEHPTQQVYDLAQLIGSQEIQQSPKQNRQQTVSTHSKQQQLQHHSRNKYASSDDDEDYEYVEQQQQPQQRISDEVIAYEEADYENQYSDYEESRKASYAESRQLQEQIAYSQEQLQRKQLQQQELEQEHLEQQLQLQSEQEQLQRRQQEIIDQVLKADQSRPASGLYLSDRGESVAADYVEATRVQSMGRSAIVSDSNNDETLVLSSETRDKIKDYSSTYKIGSLKLVGHLRGNAIIRDSSKIYELDLKELEKYYENADETLVSDQDDKKDDDDDDANQYIDPYSQDLFKDQVIELDYGAIDAYTLALNAHLIAERNNEPVPTDLRFASHILTSNHAMFLENQIFLGDAYFSSGISREVSLIANRDATKEVNALANESGSVSQSRSRSTIRNGDQAYAAHSKTADKASYATNFDENDPYSRSNSFGSAIDLQSQPGFCVSAADLNHHQNANSNDNRSQAEISNYNNNTKLTHTYDFNSHIFSNNNTTTNLNMTSNNNHATYRSPTSYLNATHNYMSQNNEPRATTTTGNTGHTLKSSSNINNVSNSNINYSMDSMSYHGGGGGFTKSKHMTKSDIYNINNLIAQYSQ